MAELRQRISSWWQGGQVDQVRAAMGGLIVPWEANKPKWPDIRSVSMDDEAYRKISLVFRCIQYLSNASGSAPLMLYQRERPGEKTPRPEHNLRRLLELPNENMGEAQFLSFVSMVAAITGYCVIEKERDQLGRVIGLWPLRSDRLRPIPRSNAAPDWEYRIPGYRDVFTLKARDAIVYRFADRSDGSYTGIGPLEVLLREVGVANALTDFLKSFLDRGAMPLYFAVPSDEAQHKQSFNTQAKVDAFRETFSNFGGIGRAQSVLLTPGIKDVRPLGFNFEELAYPELNDLTDTRICSAFGLHPILVGASIGVKHGTYANFEQARRGFYEDTMRFQWSRMDDAFSRQLLPEFEQDRRWFLEFDVSELPALKDDENDRVSRGNSMLQSGLASRHVAQAHAGIPVHGPDEFLIPFSAIPTPVTAVGSNARGERSAFAWISDPPALGTGEEFPEEIRAQYDRCPPGSMTSTYEDANGREYANLRALPVESVRAAMNVAAQARRVFLRAADQVAPVVQSYLDEQLERMIDALGAERSLPIRSSPGVAFLAGDAVVFARRASEAIDWIDEARRLEDLLGPWWTNLSKQAYADMAKAISDKSTVWDISNPLLRNVKDILGQRIVGIVETTRIDIENLVRQELIEGSSPKKLADRLRGLYQETYNGRSMTIARTESQLAYNLSSGAAAKQSGVVGKMQLHDNPNHTTDPGSDGLTCAERNGLLVTFDELNMHCQAEHPNGTLATSPVIAKPLGVA